MRCDDVMSVRHVGKWVFMVVMFMVVMFMVVHGGDVRTDQRSSTGGTGFGKLTSRYSTLPI